MEIIPNKKNFIKKYFRFYAILILGLFIIVFFLVLWMIITDKEIEIGTKIISIIIYLVIYSPFIILARFLYKYIKNNINI